MSQVISFIISYFEKVVEGLEGPQLSRKRKEKKRKGRNDEKILSLRLGANVLSSKRHSYMLVTNIITKWLDLKFYVTNFFSSTVSLV